MSTMAFHHSIQQTCRDEPTYRFTSLNISSGAVTPSNINNTIWKGNKQHNIIIIRTMLTKQLTVHETTWQSQNSSLFTKQHGDRQQVNIHKNSSLFTKQHGDRQQVNIHKTTHCSQNSMVIGSISTFTKQLTVHKTAHCSQNSMVIGNRSIFTEQLTFHKTVL